MEALMKLFPFMPTKADGGKLAIALVFYAALWVFGMPIGIVILGLSIVFTLLVPVFILALTAYSLMGILFALIRFASDGDKKE